jgi:hypothetical protein
MLLDDFRHVTERLQRRGEPVPEERRTSFHH